MTPTRSFAAFIGALFLVAGLAASQAQAHHNFNAEFDASAPVTLKGTILSVEWVNPHTWIHMVVSEPGKPDQRWMAEATTPNALLRAGVDRTALAAGTQVTFAAFRPRTSGACPAPWTDSQPARLRRAR